jgi:pyruvate dehydrogenase E1 component beta subunit
VTRPLSYAAAIAEALTVEMRRDPSVIVFGLDVTDHKRIYGSTAGLQEAFGPERVFGAPLSEDALTGMALGAAMHGLRPVLIHIRADFALLGMNQIANVISSARYMSGGAFSVPLVIRAVVGRGWGQAAQHSKSLHGVFAHFPGLKVVMPTTPRDAKGLLSAAIRDDNPVICLEHRWLYGAVDEVPEGEFTIPIGPPALLREGRDVTIAATSWMVVESLMAADLLKEAGVSAEVIDVRTAAPLEAGPLLASAAKTVHAVVADNDWACCGFGAELAARIVEGCWGSLKAPPVRLGFAPVPCPATRPLENLFYPNAETIVRTVERLLDLKPMDLSGREFYSWTKHFKGPF